MRILLVANPRSRSGAAARRIPTVLSALTQRATVEMVEAGSNTAQEVATHLQHGVWQRVVALGGDGTFARVADGVLDAESDVPLALLPAGLANNQGRGLGLPTIYDALEEVVDAVFATGRLQFDVGLLNGARFYDTVGLGFQAAVLGRRERIRERRGLGGELGYTVATGLEFFHRQGFAATVTVDGRTVRWERVLDVVVSNSVWYGGRWVLDRTARVDDGLLEVVGVRGWRDLIRHGVRDLSGGTADLQGSEILVETDRLVPSQIDGEIGQTGRSFAVQVLAGALTVVEPTREGTRR